MKKILYLLIPLFLIALVVTGVIITNKDDKTSKEKTDVVSNSDNIKFKEEYESLNGKTNSKGKEYVHVEIEENNHIKYAKYDEVVDLLTKGTGIIYFGFPECPWCRTAVPVLIDAYNELNVEDSIYYFNALDIRDNKKLDENGNIVTEKESTDEYKKLVEIMYDKLPVYKGLNDDTIKRIYFPTVVFVKDGNIIDIHVSTLDSQEDPYVKLSKEQYNELKQIYMDGINETYDILCDESC